MGAERFSHSKLQPEPGKSLFIKWLVSEVTNVLRVWVFFFLNSSAFLLFSFAICPANAFKAYSKTSMTLHSCIPMPFFSFGKSDKKRKFPFWPFSIRFFHPLLHMRFFVSIGKHSIWERNAGICKEKTGKAFKPGTFSYDEECHPLWHCAHCTKQQFIALTSFWIITSGSISSTSAHVHTRGVASPSPHTRLFPRSQPF